LSEGTRTGCLSSTTFKNW